MFRHQFSGKILQRVQSFTQNTFQVLKGISIVDTPGILSGEKQRTGGNGGGVWVDSSCAEICTHGRSCVYFLRERCTPGMRGVYFFGSNIHPWGMGVYFLCRNMHHWEGSVLMMCSCEVLYHMLSERINSTDFCRE